MYAYLGVGACPGYYSSSINYRTASKNLALLIYYLAPFTESLKIISNFSEKVLMRMCYKWEYHVVRNSWGRKLSRIGRKGAFHREIFHEMLIWSHKGVACLMFVGLWKSFCVSVFLSVFLSVCKLANCYIPRLWASRTMLYDSLWRFKRMYCVDLAENALFSSFGGICRF